MTESSVLSEIEFCAAHFGLCVLPRSPKKLSSPVWNFADIDHHVGIIWRVNTGATMATYNGRQRFIRFGMAGLADFTGFLFKSGQRAEIKAKYGAGRLSPAQESFAKLCGNAGVLWGLVRSYADCEALFKKWGLKRT